MLETSETAPPAARRDRSLAARQAKASRESRIVEGLNRGVSLADIAEREHVGEKRMRVIVHEILAHRMPKPPAEFVATQVSRLEAALRVSYDAMAVDNLRAVALVVKIVRELDRYHGFAAAERWGLAAAPEALQDPADQVVMAHMVDRIRQSTLDELARENAMAPKTPDPRDMALDAAGQAPDPVEAPPTSPQMAPQSLEKIESAPGNGSGSGTPDPRDMAGAVSAGRTADPVQAPTVGCCYISMQLIILLSSAMKRAKAPGRADRISREIASVNQFPCYSPVIPLLFGCYSAVNSAVNSAAILLSA